jgi:hypothetical protein
MDLTLEEIIQDRLQFENEMYDLLVNIELLAPPSFWDPIQDPVIVQLPESYEFEKVIVCEPLECFVCFNNFTEFNKLKCCNKKMCEGCTTKWFASSVKCPFCNQDLRNFTS